MLNYLASSFMPELINYLLNLIDEILDLSRIEAGQVDLLMQALSLEAVISDSLN